VSFALPTPNHSKHSFSRITMAHQMLSLSSAYDLSARPYSTFSSWHTSLELRRIRNALCQGASGRVVRARVRPVGRRLVNLHVRPGPSQWMLQGKVSLVTTPQMKWLKVLSNTCRKGSLLHIFIPHHGAQCCFLFLC
jgi:hypothetical protein